MSARKLSILITVLAVASMILPACTAPATPQVIVQTQVVTQEKQVIQTQVVEKEVEKVVTATPLPTAEPATFAAKDPTTYVYSSYGEPETLDPALDYETGGEEILLNVYETLIWYNKGKATEFMPQLAEKWTVSDDGKTYTFNIRKGVKFHDGSDLTPGDVAYSLQRGILQGGTASPQWLLVQPFFGPQYSDIADLIDAELEDQPDKLKTQDAAKLKDICTQLTTKIAFDDAAGTVTMKLAQPWGPFLATLANTWGSIMNKAWVAKNGGWDGSCATWQNFYGVTSDNDKFTSITNGTGPYQLDHWTKGQEIRLTRNDSYWRQTPAWDGAPSGVAKTQNVLIKYVTEWGTRFAMLKAGDADGVHVDATNFSQADPLVGETCAWNTDKGAFDACQATTTPNGALRLWSGMPQGQRTDMFFTWKINVPEGGNPFVGSGKLDGDGISPDFFSDVHVRKAFNYCFDWDTLISDAYHGEAMQSTGIALPGMIGYDPKTPIYKYDPAQCESEFKASTLKSADGKSLWDTGFRMQIAFNSGNLSRQTTAQILQQDIAQVNPKFQVEVISMAWPTLLKYERTSMLPLVIDAWIEDIHDPHDWYQPYLSASGNFSSKQNMPAEVYKQFDDLISQGATELDPAKRQEIYQRINQMAYDQAVDIIGVVPTGRHYEQRYVKGFYYNPIFPHQGAYYYSLAK